ncbi:hypothetical protein A2U01_0026350, partial [Trifolium medium]|nr:hypothetical protein [Trifolium medium]
GVAAPRAGFAFRAVGFLVPTPRAGSSCAARRA